MSDGEPLTPAAIVESAIALADADGLDALSMRRIAAELGTGPMSLYRHVSDKGALVHAMTEEVASRFTYPDAPAASWRECVRTAVDIDWRLFQRHPWVAFAFSLPRHGFGTTSLRCLDWLVSGLMDGLAVDVGRATQMALAVWDHVGGAALGEASRHALRSLPADDGSSGLIDLLAGRLEAPPPTLAGLTGWTGGHLLTDARARLDTGIELLCDGFEASASDR